MAIISTQFVDGLQSPGATMTLGFTAPAGTKRVLLGLVRPYDSGSSHTLSSATWNGTTMTIVGQSSADQYQSLAVVALTDPTLGAQNLVLTYSANIGKVAAIAVYLDDYGSFGTPAYGLYTNSVVVTSATGATVVAFAANTNGVSGSVTAGTGETEVNEYAPVNTAIRMAVLTETGAASVTIAPTITGSGDNFVFGVSVVSSGGSAPGAYVQDWNSVAVSEDGYQEGSTGYRELQWGHRNWTSGSSVSARYNGNISGTRYVSLVSFVVRSSSVATLSGSGRFLITVVADTSSTDQDPTLTLAGATLTKGAATITGTNALYGYYLVEPSTGAQTLAWTGLTAGAKPILHTVINNVSRAVPVRQVQTLSLANVNDVFTKDISSTANTLLVTLIVSTQGSEPTFAPAAGNTLRWSNFVSGKSIKVLTASGTGGTVTVGGTFSGHTAAAPFQMLVFEVQSGDVTVAAQAVLKKTVTKTCSASAVKILRPSKTTTATGVLKRLGATKTTSASAVITISSAGKTRTVAAQAVLKRLNRTVQVTYVDAIKVAAVTARTKTTSASARLTRTVVLRQVAANAVLVRTNAGLPNSVNLFQAKSTKR